jgi:mitogen-activated protein kinase kinase
MPSISFRDFYGKDFEDQEEVGWGFSGLVLKSFHRPSNRVLARKIIHETPRKRAELTVSRYEAEFYEKMKEDSNSNIVKCYGKLPVGTKGHIHGGLVFEFMDLGSLADFLILHNHNPIPEKIILYIAQNLLKACAQLEKLGIVHRDIKPSNILFNSQGGVKLCDFGEACYDWESKDKNCDYGRMAGSTAYMSPERLSCKEHGHSSDIWSVGLVLLELTCNNFPFATMSTDPSSDSVSFDGDCSIIELWEMVMESDPLPQVSSDYYSRGLQELVNLCMRKDPNDRPSAQILLSQFDHFFTESMATKDNFIEFIS